MGRWRVSIATDRLVPDRRQERCRRVRAKGRKHPTHRVRQYRYRRRHLERPGHACRSGLCALRSIINISGDGKETIAPKRMPVPTLPMARERAEQMDVTINGLVVADDGGDLASYYADKVIVGSNAFVMGVSSYSEYAAAIRAN
jgi:hypothetical protein